jgi:EAL domain-containing protein (putative c-di-GMP-specific phosphodiesterase class I)
MDPVGNSAAGLRLRAAVEEKQFRLCYQPQTDPHTGRIVGAEALLRWPDASGQLVGAECFLQALESTGLIVPVGDWAFRQAAEDCRAWQRLGLPRLKMGLNVSPRQLAPDLVEPMIARLRELQPYCDVQLEISGKFLPSAPEWLLRSLHILRFAGADIAIQDFGLDDSIHRQLWAMPVDALKIHRSFIARMSDPEVDDELGGMLMLARAFRLGCVAEGVETEAQLKRLTELHCERTQGFLHGAALPADRFEWMLRSAGQDPRPGPGPQMASVVYEA